MAVCFCGRNAVLRTSWTDYNPGRRFHGCPNPNSTCGFIGWVDEPICARAKVVIPGLLRSMNKLEATIKLLEEKVSRMKIYLICSWIFFAVVLLMLG